MDYTRANSGQITGVQETRGSAVDTWAYTYDQQNRLTSADRTGSSGSRSYDYTYDAAGNRTSETVDSSATTYVYNSLDQLISDGTTDYIYDEYGNLKKELQSEVEKREYFWDCENHLTKVEIDNAAHTVVFGYDDQGTRVSKKYDSTSLNRYLTEYNNPTGYSQVIGEYDDSGTVLEESYTYGLDLLSQNDSTNGLSFIHGDNLGSTRLLTNSNGGAVANSNYNYSPFGELLSGNPALTAYKFTGQYNDNDLSLQYHRARWLNTSSANWLSSDPVFDYPNNFGNPYSYVGDNPINGMDLTGMFDGGLGGSLMVSQAVGDLAVGCAFKLGNLPLGIHVGYDTGDQTPAAIYFAMALTFASLMPFVGQIIDAINFWPDLVHSWNVITGKDQNATCLEIAYNVVILGLVLTAIIIPGGRFLKSKITAAKNWVRAKRLDNAIDNAIDIKRAILQPSDCRSSKLEYLFGNATGNEHTVTRTTELQKSTQYLGIEDTLETRQSLQEYFDALVNDNNNIVGYGAQEYDGRSLAIRESLLAGPNGVAKFETRWTESPDGYNELRTMFIYITKR